jgi:hypothetical protein
MYAFFLLTSNQTKQFSQSPKELYFQNQWRAIKQQSIVFKQQLQKKSKIAMQFFFLGYNVR